MATRFGLTWWGKRWIGSLEALGAAYENRLPRGRTYARRGAVRRLEVTAGNVTARVDGSRPVPYRVTLRLPVFTDDQWDAIVAALSGQVRHVAALLDGRMPDDVDDALAGCGLSLFPHAGELATTCSCPDHANPCKHVAAVHYVLAQTFDADPFLLPALRGRGRDALLAELRAARTGVDGGRAAAGDDLDTGDGDGIAWSSLSASSLYDATGDLAAITVHPQPPAAHATTATIRRLGPPPLDGRSDPARSVAPGPGGTDVAAGSGASTAAAGPGQSLGPGRSVDPAGPGDDPTGDAATELLGAAVDGAARRAWQLATGVDGELDAAAGDIDGAMASVLAELCRHGSSTTSAIAATLARHPADVRSSLRRLVAAGLATRTGHARGTRYHAT